MSEAAKFIAAGAAGGLVWTSVTVAAWWWLNRKVRRDHV